MKKKAVVKEKEYVEEDSTDAVMEEEIHQSVNGGAVEGDNTWGVFLIFTGVLLLLNTFGIIPWEIWRTLFRFWPVTIIIAGVQMIVGNSRIGRTLSGLVALLLFSWVVLIALSEVSPEVIQKLPDFFKQPLKWWEEITI